MKEIARRQFISLKYCHVDHAYFVLNDNNFVKKFYANNDEDAIEYFMSENWSNLINNQKVIEKAYAQGGFRERYAMDNGQCEVVYINGHKCYKFTYSTDLEYQDANGATWDSSRQTWIN